MTITAGCKRNFLPGNGNGEDKIVVLSEATAGDYVRIPIGRTIPAGSGNIVKFEKLSDATVILSESSGGKWIMKPDKSAQTANNPTSVFVARHVYKTKGSYRLDIVHPVLGSAFAITNIPPPVPVLQIDTLPGVTTTGKPALRVSVKLDDPSGEHNFYIIEAVKQLVKIRQFFVYNSQKYYLDTEAGLALYKTVKDQPGMHVSLDTIPQQQFVRLNLYSSDININEVPYGNINEPMRRMFLPDDNFDGHPYTCEFLIERDLFVAKTPDERGKVLLQVKSASRELFKYLLSYEKYKTEFGSLPAIQLTSPIGNISNGVGVFGGDSQHERAWYFDKLEP